MQQDDFGRQPVLDIPNSSMSQFRCLAKHHDFGNVGSSEPLTVVR